jgi:predicted ATPase/DNA-binding SARP family transcriptional activator
MSRLALFLLGSPRIERDGVLINVDTRKAIALLAYLTVTHQRHSRDVLASLLWPEYDQTNARGALRRTLSTLNKALAGNWLDIERDTISLDSRSSSNFWLDVDHFYNLLDKCRTHGHPASETCPACVSPLSEAVTLYRDDFLAGFSLRDSPTFDDWQFFQADSLRHDLTAALERLVSCYSAMGDFKPAIAYARRWLALDRLHEPAHRILMQLYAWAGQRGAALHQYRECVQVLEQELGVAPLEATTQLYQAIKENQVPPAPLAAASPLGKEQEVGNSAALTDSLSNSPSGALSQAAFTNPLNANYPLVGRAREWSALANAYETIGSDGHVVILEGEAGIGKTRLAEEFLVHIQARGAAVAAARCYEGETHIAYGPVAAGLRAAIAQKDSVRRLEKIPLPWLVEASRLLPELITLHPGLPPAPPLDSPGAQSRFFEGLRQVLLSICRLHGKHPGVIFFDDLHWADGASLDLLTYLLRRLHEQPLYLILTWRSKQAASDHRLYRLLTEAQRSANTTVISLSRLNRSTVQELVRLVSPTDTTLPVGLVERLYSETEGLPFFLVEYLTAMTSGVLTAGNDDWSLPGGVRDLLHSRLVDVSETGWQLLNTAAVIGRSFDFDTLREASGRGEEETVVALEELIARGLVEEVRSGAAEPALTYDFSHEKLRALVYEETSLARRRLLHRRVAEVLVNHTRGHREGALAGQIAYHYRRAGNEQAAAEYYRIAGEQARTLYAHSEALVHLRMALALGHPDSAALYEAIGDLHIYLGEYNAALKSYETAAALCEPAALATVEHKLGTVYQRRGEWERAESHFESALRALGESDAAGERAKIYADWSLTAHHRAQIDRAQDLARRALELAETAQDQLALAQAHNILGILASSQGEYEQACHHLEQSLALAESLNDLGARVAALNNLALAYGASGDVERALTSAEVALALCVAQGDRHREAALHSNLADLLYVAGRSEVAMSHLKQAVAIYAEIGVEAGSVQPEIWKLAEW